MHCILLLYFRKRVLGDILTKNLCRKGKQYLILVPVRNIADFFIENPSDVIDVGQTVMVKVVEKVEEGAKLSGSTSMKVQ